MKVNDYFIEAKHLIYGTWYFTSLHKACLTLGLSYVAVFKKFNTNECTKGWYFYKCAKEDANKELGNNLNANLQTITGGK